MTIMLMLLKENRSNWMAENISANRYANSNIRNFRRRPANSIAPTVASQSPAASDFW